MIRRLFWLVSGGFLVLWLIGSTRLANIVLWLILAAGSSAVILWWFLRRLRRGRYAAYGPELAAAMSIVWGAGGRAWADLADVLGLSRTAVLRRSPVARVAGGFLGSRLGASPTRPVRYVPVVDSVFAAPYGATVCVRGIPGHSIEMWRSRASALASALRVPSVTVREPRPNLFALDLRVVDPLAVAVSVPAPAVTERGFDLPLGIDESGHCVCMDLSNNSAAVVGGVPGSGKTSWLVSALSSFGSRNDVQFLLVDGKQGHDLAALAPRAYRYLTGDDAGEMVIVRDALRDIQILMRERLRLSVELWRQPNLWTAGPSTTHPLVIVVIDECQAYLDARSFVTKDDKVLGAEIDTIVRDLVKRGRSVGVLLVLSTQRPTADSIPTAIRDNANLRVCFGVRTREAAAAVLGEFSTEADVSPIGAPTGVGVAALPGGHVRFRSPFVPDGAACRHMKSFEELTANPLDLLARSLLSISG